MSGALLILGMICNLLATTKGREVGPDGKQVYNKRGRWLLAVSGVSLLGSAALVIPNLIGRL